MLTEGVRLADYREFQLPVSAGPIAPIRVGEGQAQGDEIEHKETRYRVRDVQDWSVSPAGYAESGSILVLGVRIDGQ